MSTPVPSNGPGAQYSPGMKLVAVFVAGALFGAFSAVEISSGRGGGGGGNGGGNFASSEDGGDGGGGDGFSDDSGDVAFEGDGEFTGDGEFVDGGTGGDFGSGSTDSGSTDFGSSGSTDSGSSGSTDSGSGGTSSGGTSSGSSSSGGTRPGGGGVGVTGGGSGGGGGATGSGGGGGTNTGGGAGCKGSSGDKVSEGVTPTAIKVASTVVLDGPGASLLSSSPVGMRAVINKTNRAGGICGRRIELTTVNDSWDAARGQQILRRFIEEDYFALTVVPSSEGLGQAIDSGDIDKAGIPVVGTDGMRINQYKSGWVWPVATATISTMRIIAQHAYSAKQARKFGIVWDQKFRFGIEGATAYKEQVKKLGGSITADMPLDPDRPSYGTEAQTFNRGCGAAAVNCDAVALLLVPSTALTWKNANSGDKAGRGAKATYGHQTLFTDEFASACRDWCDQMIVWTGYNPPIPPVDTKPGVAKYQQDVRAERAGIDFRNQFLEGAYLGMALFVEAATKCSPNLTRDCLKNALNTMEFKTDLANTLKWGATARHANKFAQAFQIEASGGSFNGWRYLQTGWVKDPAL